jgi:hypothetical protein
MGAFRRQDVKHRIQIDLHSADDTVVARGGEADFDTGNDRRVCSSMHFLVKALEQLELMHAD